MVVVAGSIVALMLAGASGCARRVPAVNDQLLQIGREQGASAEQLRRGYDLLNTACAYCHVPVYPTSISMGRWDKALPRMIEKARLSAVDEADIRAYLVAARTWLATSQSTR